MIIKFQNSIINMENVVGLNIEHWSADRIVLYAYTNVQMKDRDNKGFVVFESRSELKVQSALNQIYDAYEKGLRALTL